MSGRQRASCAVLQPPWPCSCAAGQPGRRWQRSATRQLHSLPLCPSGTLTPHQTFSTLAVRLTIWARHSLAGSYALMPGRAPSSLLMPLPAPARPEHTGHTSHTACAMHSMPSVPSTHSMRSAAQRSAAHLDLVPDVLHLAVQVHLVRTLPRLALVHHVGHQVVLGRQRRPALACAGRMGAWARIQARVSAGACVRSVRVNKRRLGMD